MPAPAKQAATLDGFFAIPEAERFHELLAGVITERAAPSGEHGGAQAGVVACIAPPYQRRQGQGGPGGWWIATEVEVLLPAGDVVRPDVVGWRRERCPVRPIGTPVTVRPDWVCEIVSASNASDDTVKVRVYHAAGVPHYWIIDPRDATLTVLRWSDDGYLDVLRAERGETIRAEPFDAIEIAVGSLFGDDPP